MSTKQESVFVNLSFLVILKMLVFMKYVPIVEWQNFLRSECVSEDDWEIAPKAFTATTLNSLYPECPSRHRPWEVCLAALELV